MEKRLQKKVAALVPMKGNSERVPNKNLKNFCGKPLYHHIFNTLIKSQYIDKIIVNTDSDRIKQDIERNFPSRVVIHDRPESIQGDFVSMNKVIQNDINRFDADVYIQTHSTNPLLSTRSIDNALALMLASNFYEQNDSIFSVTKIQTRLYDEKGNAVNHNPKELIRTQDLPPLFEENSNFFIFTKDSFENSGNRRIGLRPYLYEIRKDEAIDIDDIHDFAIAEALYSLKHQ